MKYGSLREAKLELEFDNYIFSYTRDSMLWVTFDQATIIYFNPYTRDAMRNALVTFETIIYFNACNDLEGCNALSYLCNALVTFEAIIYFNAGQMKCRWNAMFSALVTFETITYFSECNDLDPG